MVETHAIRKRWCFVIVQLLAILLALSAPVTAAIANPDITPEEVKASYILQMRQFISLGNPGHPIREICYYEKSGVPYKESVGQIIAKYLQKNPQQPSVSVKWFKAIRDFSSCDVFYIPADEEGNIDNILAALGSNQTLTMSDAERFIFRGGMIGFVLDNANHVKMEGNLTNIKSKDIQVDAQVLEIMQRVEGQ